MQLCQQQQGTQGKDRVAAAAEGLCRRRGSSSSYWPFICSYSFILLIRGEQSRLPPPLCELCPSESFFSSLSAKCRLIAGLFVLLTCFPPEESQRESVIHADGILSLSTHLRALPRPSWLLQDLHSFHPAHCCHRGIPLNFQLDRQEIFQESFIQTHSMVCNPKSLKH